MAARRCMRCSSSTSYTSLALATPLNLSYMPRRAKTRRGKGRLGWHSLGRRRWADGRYSVLEQECRHADRAAKPLQHRVHLRLTWHAHEFVGATRNHDD
eukprot:scaffold89781_cov69-Phaeocystis_antarctica.AAC.5